MKHAGRLFRGGKGMYGCGPAALSAITGINPEQIANDLVADRIGRPKPKGFGLERDWREDGEITYTAEITRFLYKLYGWKIRWNWFYYEQERDRIRLSKFKFPQGDKVYLVQTSDYVGHLNVVMRGRVWDSRNNGDPLKGSTYGYMDIAAWAVLPIEPYGHWAFNRRPKARRDSNLDSEKPEVYPTYCCKSCDRNALKHNRRLAVRKAFVRLCKSNHVLVSNFRSQ